MAHAGPKVRSAAMRPKRSAHFLLFDRAVLILVRRLIGPFVLFLVFVLLCVFAYMRLEHLRLSVALFLVAHPPAIEYRDARSATKYLSLIVASGIFALD